eukprot:4308145-Ditylum_brightwellii.AAC.1
MISVGDNNYKEGRDTMRNTCTRRREESFVEKEMRLSLLLQMINKMLNCPKGRGEDDKRTIRRVAAVE